MFAIRYGVVAAACSAALLGCTPAPAATPGPAPAPGPATFTVVATGDVLIHQDGSLEATAAAAGRAHGATYDFTPVLADITPVIRGADLAVCHLETPVAAPGGPFSNFPAFSVQPQILDALKGAGYDTCSTASNHSLDAGTAGVIRTLDALDARRIRHAGTARSAAEEARPTIIDVRGVKVAQVSATFSLNGYRRPADRPWLVDTFDQDGPDVAGILADAAAARRAGAAVVIASVHMGTEYVQKPTAAQRAVAARLLDSPDVDLVLGSHAHVVQPIERRGTKWVAYGLGNLVAEQGEPDTTMDSVIARFTFTRGPDGRYAVSKTDAIPLRIRSGGTRFAVVRTGPEDPSFRRVSDTVNGR